MSAALKPEPPMPLVTAEEFLFWPEDDNGIKWELVDGEPVAMAPPSARHAAIQAELAGMLRDALRVARSPCRVLVGPGVQPREQSRTNVRIPDIAVECAPPSDVQITPTPTFVAEVLSPGNERRTRRNVWVYKTLPSVREILLLYGWKCQGELLRRSPDNSWPDAPELLGADATLRLETAQLSAPFRDAYATSGLLEVTPPG